jgi:hypothetical protein
MEGRGEKCSKISVRAEPRLPVMPLHNPMRHPGEQPLEQANLASIGYAGERNAFLQEELGARCLKPAWYPCTG